MNKINYYLKMLEIIKGLTYKPKLLLHSCCAPCSSSVIETLLPYFDITVLYYNPNIYPLEEYEKRLNEQKRFLNKLKINLIELDYNESEFLTKIKGLENEKEGGNRCYNCYYLRMEKTAQVAKEKQFDYFCTTLSVSPHKNSQFINEIGEILQKEYGIAFLFSDFKKNNGYLRSLTISKEENFYRQAYCGCKYSFLPKNI